MKVLLLIAVLWEFNELLIVANDIHKGQMMILDIQLDTFKHLRGLK